MKLSQTCLAALALAASAAHAQWYGEIGVSPLTVKATVDGNTLKAHPTMMGVLVGYNVHPNLALEGMAATNVNSDTISLNGSDVAGAKLKVKSAYGVFLKPKAMLSSDWEVFGRLGWIESRTNGAAEGYSVTETDNDFAYGLGVNYHFNKTTYGSLGYTSFYDKHNIRTRGFTLGVGMQF